MNKYSTWLGAGAFAFLASGSSWASNCELDQMRNAALRGERLSKARSCSEKAAVPVPEASPAAVPPRLPVGQPGRDAPATNDTPAGSSPIADAPVSGGVVVVNAREQIAAALAYDLGVIEAVRSADLRESSLVGAASGGMGVVTEGVQILGQIVADKASNAAFVRARDLLLKELHCQAANSDTSTGSTTGSETVATPNFALTCATLSGVRLQDLAASRETLLLAFVTDIADQLHGRLGAAGSSVYDGEVPLVREVLAGIGHTTTGHSDESAYLLSSSLVGSARRLGLGADFSASSVAEEATSPGNAAWVVGVAAFLRCRAASSAGGFSGDVRACPADEFAEQMLRGLRVVGEPPEPTPVELALARQTAMRLLFIHGGSKSGDGGNPRTKLRAAVELGFDVACFQASGGRELCKSASTLAVPNPSREPIDRLSALRNILLSAVEGDTNAVMRDVALALKLVPGTGKADRYYKATRLLGTIADYSLTYTNPGEGTPEELHAARTKVLQSLVDEMTYRADRGGADIFSLGGALGLVGGLRMPFQGGGGITPASPLTLRLGVGFDHVPEGDGPGFHFEASMVDLGQYLSWDAGEGQPVRVLEPSPEALLSPSIAVGMAWGRELPWVLSAVANYAPSYSATGDTSHLGALSFGASLGVYVPLFDLN